MCFWRSEIVNFDNRKPRSLINGYHLKGLFLEHFNFKPSKVNEELLHPECFTCQFCNCQLSYSQHYQHDSGHACHSCFERFRIIKTEFKGFFNPKPLFFSLSLQCLNNVKFGLIIVYKFQVSPTKMCSLPTQNKPCWKYQYDLADKGGWQIVPHDLFQLFQMSKKPRSSQLRAMHARK